MAPDKYCDFPGCLDEEVITKVTIQEWKHNAYPAQVFYYCQKHTEFISVILEYKKPKRKK